MEQLEHQKNEMLNSIKDLSSSLEHAYSKISEFYERMRYENLGLSEEEYSEFYESGKIYQIEEFEILDKIENLKKSIDAGGF